MHELFKINISIVIEIQEWEESFSNNTRELRVLYINIKNNAYFCSTQILFGA